MPPDRSWEVLQSVPRFLWPPPRRHFPFRASESAAQAALEVRTVHMTAVGLLAAAALTALRLSSVSMASRLLLHVVRRTTCHTWKWSGGQPSAQRRPPRPSYRRFSAHDRAYPWHSMQQRPHDYCQHSSPQQLCLCHSSQPLRLPVPHLDCRRRTPAASRPQAHLQHSTSCRQVPHAPTPHAKMPTGTAILSDTAMSKVH